MQIDEKVKLIEDTIKAVEGNYSLERLIQDCADKLSISDAEVRMLLEKTDSEILKEYSAKTF